MVRRLRLALGEAMPWHRDPCNRVAVVLRGDLLSIEYAMVVTSALRSHRDKWSGSNPAPVFIGR